MEQILIDRKRQAEEKKRGLERRRKELIRRSKLFIEDFTDLEYRVCRDYCRETFRMVLDMLNTLSMQLTAKERRVRELEQVLIDLGVMNKETKKIVSVTDSAA